MTRQRRSRWLAGSLIALLLLGVVGSLPAQTQNLPPKPDRYVTDQAGVLDAETAEEINGELEQFEKNTSDQILVAIYPSLPPDAEVAQYCTYTAESWAAGQKGKDNGAVLFVFVQDRKTYIAVGRGLEGSLPDATCKNIIMQVIVPHFRQGDYAGGIQAGVAAMLAAVKGEYQGNGTTVGEERSHQGIPWVVILVFIVIFILTRYGSSSGWAGPIIFTGGGWGGGGYGGGGFSGGGGGGGGGFSGGGGSFGGGGAGGSW